jgi:hypothetical protein
MSGYKNEDDLLPDVDSLSYRGQSRRMSFIESCANTAFGFVISVAAAFIIFPLIGIQSTGVQNVLAVVLFTFVSIARNYVVRRVFTKL